ncbi:site-specific DNA-methyltransferase [Flavobacteriaceae bacterium XHP0103]|uniref:DNA-methyltransferase n=1 Tax=Marixanthotalea marina TaxID=2844359 RepID=UPI00298A03B1|nr:DNA methyltransferase [Marixanthotalea marina]MBU3823168.1 site-specific DNA-methyltransferase [Marixanthotalea marina]
MEVVTEKLTIKQPKVELFNMDNMELMARYPDKHFNLAIVDPPYGVGLNVGRNNQDLTKGWDDAIPPKEYFNELFRVSKNYIIWGGNYFSHLIPAARCFIYWDKPNIEHLPTMADGELALTSFSSNAKKYSVTSALHDGKRFHPTQKPVKLYEWLLINYAKEGDIILDTHLGSGSSAIAAYNYKFDFVGCEIDKEYFEKAKQRFEDYKSQLTLF